MNEKMYYQTFIVRGRLSFPVDMLRYDRCHPIEGIGDLENSFNPRVRMDRKDVFEVKLGRWVDHWSRMPTDARWSSFLWAVDRGSIVTDVDGERVTARMVDGRARKVTS